MTHKYIADIGNTGAFDSSQKEDSKVYSVLLLIAQDFVSGPALRAFVERLF